MCMKGTPPAQGPLRECKQRKLPASGAAGPLLVAAMLFSFMASPWRLACAAGDASASSMADAPAYRLGLIGKDASAGTDAAISKDGRYVVVSSRRGGGVKYSLWLYDTQKNLWRSLGNAPGDQMEPQFSPDGSKIVYTSTAAGNKDIWVLTLATMRRQRITDSPDDDEYAAWSPDGRTIVYTGGPWKANNFYLVELKNGVWGHPKPVLAQPGRIGSCNFMESSERLLCHTYESGFGQISVFSRDGTRVARLTQGPEWDYKAFSSPTGQEVAFSRISGTSSTIWVRDARRGVPYPVTVSPYQDRWPMFYNDNSIFFHRIKREGTQVVLLDRATGKSRVIVDSSEKPLQAAMDSKSDLLAYCSDTGDRLEMKILDMKARRTVTVATDSHSACYPRWSPDGQHLGFLVFDGVKWKLAVADRSGSGFRQIDGNVDFVNGVSGPIDWSPNSTSVLLAANTAAYETGIYTIDVDSKAVTQLTQDEWFNEAPSWSSSGNEIGFMSTRGGGFSWGLFRLSLRDKAIAQIVRPSYDETNYPRIGRQSTIWTQYRPCDGRPYIVEARPGKAPRILYDFPGAIWPSFTANEAEILFTRIEDTVEFWSATPVASGPGT